MKPKKNWLVNFLKKSNRKNNWLVIFVEKSNWKIIDLSIFEKNRTKKNWLVNFWKKSNWKNNWLVNFWKKSNWKKLIKLKNLKSPRPRGGRVDKESIPGELRRRYRLSFFIQKDFVQFLIVHCTCFWYEAIIDLA